jgi:hypothetical protein
MYTLYSFKPFKKAVFTSIWYQDQPKTDARDIMVMMEVYLATGAKLSSKSNPFLWENPLATNLRLEKQIPK